MSDILSSMQTSRKGTAPQKRLRRRSTNFTRFSMTAESLTDRSSPTLTSCAHLEHRKIEMTKCKRWQIRWQCFSDAMKKVPDQSFSTATPRWQQVLLKCINHWFSIIHYYTLLDVSKFVTCYLLVLDNVTIMRLYYLCNICSIKYYPSLNLCNIFCPPIYFDKCKMEINALGGLWSTSAQ